MPNPADLLLRNAPVYDAGAWVGDCLAVRRGRIAGLGAYADVEHLVDGTTEERDLTGTWLLPGFHDAHVHPVSAGVELNQCDLSAQRTIEEYVAHIATYAAEHPDRPWVTGAGWSMEAFPGGVPTAALLDPVGPGRPVYLPNRDHHSAWVNTRALELAGITAATPDPADGRIERDARGTPTGALHEGAMGLVGALVPALTDDDLMAGLLTAQAHLHSLGVVGWQDALVGDGLGMTDYLPTYLRATADGTLTAKVRAALWWDRGRGAKQLAELVERRERARTAGFRATSVKIMQDGVCETFTAAVLEPYLGTDGRPTDNGGIAFIQAGDLAEYVMALDAADFQVHVHALGDRAVRDSLDAFEQARARNGARGNRHHLAHLQIVHPDDVPRFAELEVTANAQPRWACRDAAMEQLTLPFLPPAAREQQYVFGSLRASGARLAFGSDWPVSSPDPLAGIHVAVNRRGPDQGPDVEPLLAHERLSLTDCLDTYTGGSAWVNGLDGISGALRVGHAADIAVIDQDLLAVPSDAIADVRVVATFADGVEVYRR